MRRTLILVILLLVFAMPVSAQISHNVTGTLVRSDGVTVPPTECIVFVAWLNDNRSDTLTQNSPGCGYFGEYACWVVNTGNFASSWHSGDILHIYFYDSCVGEEYNFSCVLNDDPTQNVGQVTLPVEEEESTETIFSLYPNPADGYVPLTLPEDALGVSVYNITGKKILYVENRKYIEVSTLPPGVYFVRVSSGGMDKISRIIVK